MSGRVGKSIKQNKNIAPRNELRIAYDVLKKVISDGAFANLVLKEVLNDTDSRIASSVTALVYTVLENISYTDYIIAHYAKGRVQGNVKIVLRIGITRIMFMNVPDHVAVNSACELIRSIGKGELCGFVNGVLRKIARDNSQNTIYPLPNESCERLCIRFGIPKGLAKEYIDEYGFEFAENMLLSRAHKLTVRAQYPFTTDALRAELNSREIEVSTGSYDVNALILEGGINPAELDLFKEGKLAVQSESAMLTVRACCISDGMMVLDTCAAPGGKSAYIASLMKNTGHITAWEVHEHRTELMKTAFKRLNITNINCETKDASKDNIDDEAQESFDVVLVDAPCSGLGGGGKPDALLRRTDKDIDELADIQLRILINAAKYVKNGGALVYSTCTVSRRENEANIERFLEKRRDFKPENLGYMIETGNLEHDSTIKRGELGIQLFPNVDGIDGFYIARMIKENSEK